MPCPTISVVIVSYNTRDELRDCLRSLRRVSSEATGGMDITVVDNASSDGSQVMVESEFREVRLFNLIQNIGFAAGVNRGVEGSSGDYCFVLNPDTWVSRGTVGKLLKIMESDHNIAVVGCGLHTLRGRDLPSAFREPGLLREFWNLIPELKHFLGLSRLSSVLRQGESRSIKNGQEPELRDVESVSGAAMMIRRKAFLGVGGFDEAFFLYHEEIDLCIRLRRAGWRVVSSPSATVVHHDATATGYKTSILPANPVLSWRLSGMDRLWFKHKSRSAHLAWRRQTLLLLGLRLVVLSIVSRFRKSEGRRIAKARRAELKEWILRLRAV